MLCKRCIVRGRVQGVFFRATAAKEAATRGVTGHAVNLEDGTVEVLACGPPREVEAVCAWLREGPPMASVDSVECETVSCKVPATFTTGRA